MLPLGYHRPGLRAGLGQWPQTVQTSSFHFLFALFLFLLHQATFAAQRRKLRWACEISFSYRRTSLAMELASQIRWQVGQG